MTLSADAFKIPGARSGFTLLEMMVVVAILAILAMMAVPAYLRMLPYMEVKADARAVSVTFQRARMTAANSQKPTRVLLDCTAATRKPVNGHPTEPCRLQTQLAVYNSQGAIKEWKTVDSGQIKLHLRVSAAYPASGAPHQSMVQFDMYRNFFTNFETADGGTGVSYGMVAPTDGKAADTSFVVAFLPDGSAITAITPLAINFVSGHFDYDPARLSLRLSIANTTGRISLDRQSQTGG